MNEPDELLIFNIQEGLFAWFEVSGRSFPWRETKDPYKILIAEKLLQKTSVRPYLVEAYIEIIGKYPTINDLAEAKVEDVLNLVKPLGLHYRAKELINLAQVIQIEHCGIIPRDIESLLRLPGVGDYTARALLCFGFGEDVPIVDTNVARILHRLFDLPGKLSSNPARKKSLIEMAGRLIPQEGARDFNFAVLDLGALLCISTNPLCGDCPLSSFCVFARKNRSEL